MPQKSICLVLRLSRFMKFKRTFWNLIFWWSKSAKVKTSSSFSLCDQSIDQTGEMIEGCQQVLPSLCNKCKSTKIWKKCKKIYIWKLYSIKNMGILSFLHLMQNHWTFIIFKNDTKNWNRILFCYCFNSKSYKSSFILLLTQPFAVCMKNQSHVGIPNCLITKTHFCVSFNYYYYNTA